jgi:hypothetical protein
LRVRIKPPCGITSREAERFDQLDRLLSAQPRCPSVAGLTRAISPNDLVESGTVTFIRLCHPEDMVLCEAPYKPRHIRSHARQFRAER